MQLICTFKMQEGVEITVGLKIQVFFFCLHIKLYKKQLHTAIFILMISFSSPAWRVLKFRFCANWFIKQYIDLGFFVKYSNCKRSLESFFDNFQLRNLTWKSNVCRVPGHKSQNLFPTWPPFCPHSRYGKEGGKGDGKDHQLPHLKSPKGQQKVQCRYVLRDYNLLKWVQAAAAEWCLVVCICIVKTLPSFSPLCNHCQNFARLYSTVEPL